MRVLSSVPLPNKFITPDVYPHMHWGFFIFEGLQRLTKVGFKVEVMVPIVTLLDSTSNPLALLGVWSQYQTYTLPRKIVVRSLLLLFPIPNPFPGFFFAP